MPTLQSAGIIRVTGSWIRLLTDWLDRVGAEAPALRAAVAAYSPTDNVPIADWSRMLEQAFALRPQDRAPTLDLASLVTLAHTGVLGYLAAACDNLGQALLSYQRFEQLFYGASIAQISAEAQDNTPCVSIRWQPLPAMAQVEEVAIAALVAITRQHLVRDVPLLSVHFHHQPDAQRRQALEAFFGCPVLFGQPQIRLVFAASVLTLPLMRGEPGLRGLLEEQASSMLRAVPESDEFLRQLQAELVRVLPEGEATIESLAPRLFCSVRTLQRRLDAKQLTWKALLDRTREQLACQYLADHSLSLLEVSMLLGYRNQGTFSRAFRRWRAMSPLAFRQQLRCS
ncbi:AraC family transcriptional regulator ligand-binding domain-containing protein [Thalassolituus sp. LLYu03]|uniref:AraC family transcriptional regulator n=1 Tax=Thalassolituus sp. LLYu03 TaxID=3421656 RepID=UPI003D2B3283